MAALELWRVELVELGSELGSVEQRRVLLMRCAEAAVRERARTHVTRLHKAFHGGGRQDGAVRSQLWRMRCASYTDLCWNEFKLMRFF